MIKTTLRAEIAGVLYEYVVEMPSTAPWADTPEETAVGLLNESMDQLTRALGHEDIPQEPELDEFGNHVCYLCGFWHQSPGACADPNTPLINLNPGPPEPPEYGGPTMPDHVRYPTWDETVIGDYDVDPHTCTCTCTVPEGAIHASDCGTWPR